MKEKTDLAKHIAGRIRRRRRALGLTQAQFGELLGMRFQQIQKYETAANNIQSTRLYEMAKVLKVNVSYFYSGFGDGDTSTHDLAADYADMLRAFEKLDERARQGVLQLVHCLAHDEVAQRARERAA